MSTITESLSVRPLRLWAEDSRVRTAVGILAFAVAAAVSAQVAIRLPWTPVPLTFQPLVVVLAGVVLGARAGALAMAAYVTVGALGAPVFALGGAGLPWLLGPTGGYLLATPAAAFVAGVVAGRREIAWRLLSGLTLGVATMYVGGVVQLMALTGQGIVGAATLGVVPFLVGDVTKVLFAFFIVLAVRRKRGATAE
jgi:biotin transport system substrate-specific component